MKTALDQRFAAEDWAHSDSHTPSVEQVGSRGGGIGVAAGLEDDAGHEATHEHDHRGVAPGGALLRYS
jgi:hypothetical protein